jgi:NAD(P)-dependent dehydrogenase (short-subunit alcohol dehydrogenase family)
MSSSNKYPEKFPPQGQPEMEGREHKMYPRPRYDAPWHKGSNKLHDKVALITGGDSGIGRSVAVLFAREGANVAINFLQSDDDATETQKMVEKEGRKCLLVKGDVSQKSECERIVETTVKTFGHLDILVNNAAKQRQRDDITEITEEQLDETFRTNIYHMFYMVQAALPHLRQSKGNIINTTSIVNFRGNPKLIDYTATKGAITAYTRSLAKALAGDGIRVNMVAPGPIWTPLIVASFGSKDPNQIPEWGTSNPMGRPGQPEECSPAYVFLASQDASYISGQTIHVNGGDVVNA